MVILFAPDIAAGLVVLSKYSNQNRPPSTGILYRGDDETASGVSFKTLGLGASSITQRANTFDLDGHRFTWRQPSLRISAETYTRWSPCTDDISGLQRN